MLISLLYIKSYVCKMNTCSYNYHNNSNRPNYIGFLCNPQLISFEIKFEKLNLMLLIFIWYYFGYMFLSWTKKVDIEDTAPTF